MLLNPPAPKPQVLIMQEPEMQKSIASDVDFEKIAAVQLVGPARSRAAPCLADAQPSWCALCVHLLQSTLFSDDEKARTAEMKR